MTLNPEQLKAVLFDMDGTLVSSLPVIHYCVNQITGKYAHRSLTTEEVIHTFGPPAHEIIRRLTGTLDKQIQDRAVREYYDCDASNVGKKVVLFKGIPQLLAKIQQSGRHLGLVTGVEKILMDYTLNAFSLAELFETRISRDDVSKGKPDPEGVKLALSRLGTIPTESLLVGDAPADMLAAKRAGVHTAAALWSPENIGDPRRENPDLEFQTVLQLEEFLFSAR